MSGYSKGQIDDSMKILLTDEDIEAYKKFKKTSIVDTSIALYEGKRITSIVSH